VISPMSKDPSPEALGGWRVVVTRPRGQSSDLDQLLRQVGADVILLPTIEIIDPPSFDPLDAALWALADGAYDWIGFLSVNAVHRVITRLEALSLPPSVISLCQVAAVGRATADALTATGIKINLLPAISTAMGVAHALGSGSGRVLVPRAADAPNDATKSLRQQGWVVDEVVAYLTVPAAPGEEVEVVRRHEFDVVTFTSGSSVRGFAGMVSPAEAGLTPVDSEAGKVACIGPVTAKIARRLGFRVDAIATEQTTRGLLEVIVGLR
jgi:uroporphyrinogen III methyltransferase / synthase